jgi:hypothetical protein
MKSEMTKQKVNGMNISEWLKLVNYKTTKKEEVYDKLKIPKMKIKYLYTSSSVVCCRGKMVESE